MRLNFAKSTILACGLSLAAAAFARGHGQRQPAGLPPLGQRVYRLGEPDSAAPVVIAKRPSAVAPRFMRDPDQPGPLHVPVVRRQVVAKPAEVKPQVGSLRFARIKVAGHLQQPRLDFHLETLPLERADEPVGRDFYPKVFDAASQDDF